MAERTKRPRYPLTYIRKWRQHRDLTLEELSAAVGITKTSLSRIERGLQPYNQMTLEAIAKRLGVERWQLLRDDPTTEAQVIDLMLLPPESRATVRTMVDSLLEQKRRA